MTPTTTPLSGQSMDEYSRLPASDHGDPYAPVCEALHSLLSRKRNYYGCPDEGPLDNALGVKEQGIEPWVYQLARIGEKVRRCGGLQRAIVPSKREIKKTLMDIAGHAVVALALMEHEESSHESQVD
jgi:hypothetical protein